ncbi:MAG TPA: helix-turn-helix domain-containing protein [Solirubrobacteraceae bacterium]
MRTLTVIPQPKEQRKRTKDTRPNMTGAGKGNNSTGKTPSPVSLQRHTHQKFAGRIGQHIRRAFTPLIDAKAASILLGVPYTWLLAQARAGKIPHHRLGHYVRFDPDDLAHWLRETRSEPSTRQTRR